MSYGLPWVDYAYNRLQATTLPPGVELGEAICVSCPAYDPAAHGAGEVIIRLSEDYSWSGEVSHTSQGYKVDREVVASRRKRDGSLPASPRHWLRGGIFREWMDLS